MTEKKDETSEVKKSRPSWVKMRLDELEKIVVGLAKGGMSPAQIGLILRDKHGVPKAKLLGKKITQIMNENNIEIVSDEKIVNEKIKHLKNHIGKNKRDYPASRALTKRLWDVYHLKQKNA